MDADMSGSAPSSMARLLTARARARRAPTAPRISRALELRIFAGSCAYLMGLLLRQGVWTPRITREPMGVFPGARASMEHGAGFVPRRPDAYPGDKGGVLP